MYNQIYMLLPNLATTKDIQRNYRAIFDQAKNQGHVIVMTNNQPDVVIMGFDQAEALYRKVQQKELQQASEAIKAYKLAKEQKTLITNKTLAEL